jgi:predicted DNA-binding helix-hairpin-helix protein
MIVGADASDDRTILHTAQTLYGSYKLKRVYYSAFSPIPHSPSSVPSAPPPLLREHRLYQADFLLRGYGFTATELMPTAGNLALDIDPKLGWALANRDHFPLDLNRADEGMIARVPGIGLRTAKRLIDLRRLRRIRWEDLSRLRCSLKKLAPFVITADYKPAQGAASSDLLRRNLADAPQQMNLWPELQAA